MPVVSYGFKIVYSVRPALVSIKVFFQNII